MRSWTRPYGWVSQGQYITEEQYRSYVEVQRIGYQEVKDTSFEQLKQEVLGSFITEQDFIAITGMNTLGEKVKS